jgi:hypothetical protein
VTDGRRAKGLSAAKKKNGSAERRRQSSTNKMIGELREELRLIDTTIAALIRLSKLRQ